MDEDTKLLMFYSDVAQAEFRQYKQERPDGTDEKCCLGCDTALLTSALAAC